MLIILTLTEGKWKYLRIGVVFHLLSRSQHLENEETDVMNSFLNWLTCLLSEENIPNNLKLFHLQGTRLY